MSADRTALITGANRGLGLEVCRQLLARGGFNILATARDEAKAAAAVQQLGGASGRLSGHALDACDDAGIEAAVDFARKHFGGVDILINNAGVLLDGGGLDGAGDSSLAGCNRDLLRATFEANLYGPLMLARAVLPAMRDRDYGRIVNVSSGLGQLSDMGGGWPAYRMSKTALNALTRIIAAESGDAGIKVNAVSPGWVRTDMGGANASASVSEGADSIVWAATLDEDGPTGCFLENRQIIAW